MHMYTLLKHSRKAKDSGPCVSVWQREHRVRKVLRQRRRERRGVGEGRRTGILFERMSSAV